LALACLRIAAVYILGGVKIPYGLRAGEADGLESDLMTRLVVQAGGRFTRARCLKRVALLLHPHSRDKPGATAPGIGVPQARPGGAVEFERAFIFHHTMNNHQELVSAVLGFLPIGIFLFILYFFFRWQIKRQKPTVETHLTILRERNELARQAIKLQEEQNELLRKLLDR
jgi:hypothetical protein